MHLDDTADTFCLAGRRIENGHALFDLAGIDAREAERSETVIHDLERQRAQRLVRRHNGELTGLVALEINLGLRGNLGRARQEVDDSVQHQLDTLVLESGTAVGREEVQRDSALANTLLDVLDRRLVALEIGFHEVIVLLDGSLDKLLAPLLDGISHIGRNILDCVVLRQTGIVPDVSLASQQVDDALEIVLDTDRQNHDKRIGAEHILDLLDDAVEIGAETVELVDENDTGNLGFVGIAPVGFRLGFNTAGTAENTDATVEHLQ